MKKTQMIDWEKPSGMLVKTNNEPASIKKAEELGWDRVELVKVQKSSTKSK